MTKLLKHWKENINTLIRAQNSRSEKKNIFIFLFKDNICFKNQTLNIYTLNIFKNLYFLVFQKDQTNPLKNVHSKTE